MVDTALTHPPSSCSQATHPPCWGLAPGRDPTRVTESTLGARTRLTSPAPSAPSVAHGEPAIANGRSGHAPSRNGRPEAARQEAVAQPARPQQRSCAHELPAVRISPAQRHSITPGKLTHLQGERKWQMTL